jgi:hypothetical protein
MTRTLRVFAETLLALTPMTEAPKVFAETLVLKRDPF